MSVKTTRIAHVSDLHLLEPNPDGSRSSAACRGRLSTPRYGFDVRFVSLGRKLDPRARMRKVSRALDAARRVARQEFTRGRDSSDPIVIDFEDESSPEGHESPKNGAPTNGASVPATGTVR